MSLKKWHVCSFVLSLQFSGELLTPVKAGALALNDSHALGDSQIQLKDEALLS